MSTARSPGPLAFAQTNVMGTLQLLDSTLAYWKSLDADKTLPPSGS